MNFYLPVTVDLHSMAEMLGLSYTDSYIIFDSGMVTGIKNGSHIRVYTSAILQLRERYPSSHDAVNEAEKRISHNGSKPDILSLHYFPDHMSDKQRRNMKHKITGFQFYRPHDVLHSKLKNELIAVAELILESFYERPNEKGNSGPSDQIGYRSKRIDFPITPDANT